MANENSGLIDCSIHGTTFHASGWCSGCATPPHPRDRVWRVHGGVYPRFGRLVNAGVTVAISLSTTANVEPFRYIWLDAPTPRALAESLFPGIVAAGDAWWLETQRERAAIELERIRLVRACAPVLLRRCVIHDEEWDPLDPNGTGNMCPACAAAAVSRAQAENARILAESNAREEARMAREDAARERVSQAACVQRLNDIIIAADVRATTNHKLSVNQSAAWSARVRELVKASADKRAADAAIRVQPMFEDWE